MPAEPIIQPAYQSMQFDGSAAHAAELVYASDSGLLNRLLVRAAIEGFQEAESSPLWRVTLTRPDQTQMVANPTAWIVVASTGAIRVLENAEYIAEFQTQGA